MVKRLLPSSRVRSVLLSLAAFLIAVWGSGLYPVSLWADVRRAENFARGYYPNMDPGVVYVLATFLVTPLVLGVLVLELVRLLRGGIPLSPFWSLCLGSLLGIPVSSTLVGFIPPLPYWQLCLLVGCLAAAFYACFRYFHQRQRTGAC